MIRARSTRPVGSVRDREISRNCCRCSASVGSAITRRGAPTGSPNPIPRAPLTTFRRRCSINPQHIDILESLYYVTAATKLFPSAMLHWEDFGSTNCRRILGWYRDKVPTFNDDMQGTGTIVMAGLLNAVARTGGSWTEQRVVVFG